MKRMLILALLAIVVMSPIIGCQKAAVGEPIKIGVLSMVTGDMASPQYGDLSRLAAKEINEKGGINGRNIEIVEEDYGGSPEKAVLAFTKLADRDNVTLVVGPVLTNVAAAVQPIANSKKLVSIGFVWGTQLDPSAGPYNFRHMASDTMGSEVLLKYLLGQPAASNLVIGIMHDKTPAGMSSLASFVPALKNYNINPVGIEAFEMGTVTFIPYLQRLKNAGANVLYLGTITGPVMGIMRDLGVMGWRPIVIGGMGFGNIIGYQNSGGLWDGVRYWSFLDFSRKDVADFRQKVKQELNQTFEGESTIQYYDAVKLAAEALKKSGPDREAFRSNLENVRWDGTLLGPQGTVAEFTAQKHFSLALEAHVVDQWNPGGTVTTIWRK